MKFLIIKGESFRGVILIAALFVGGFLKNEIGSASEHEGARLTQFNLGPWGKRNGFSLIGHDGAIIFTGVDEVTLRLKLKKECLDETTCDFTLIKNDFKIHKSSTDHCGSQVLIASRTTDSTIETLLIKDHRLFSCQDSSGYNFPRTGTDVVYSVDNKIEQNYLYFSGSEIKEEY